MKKIAKELVYSFTISYDKLLGKECHYILFDSFDNVICIGFLEFLTCDMLE